MAEDKRDLTTVGELIDYLEGLGRDRALIYDSGGDTYIVTTDDILIWDPNSEDSPVALFERR